jgi:hypothetical protein
MAFRGSRKHVLDLLERPDYLPTINALLYGTGAVISLSDPRQPIGFADPSEDELPAFCRKHLDGVIDAACLDVGQWWTVHTGTTPNWDLLSLIKVGGQRGLLLVEAKAHGRELEQAGKPLRADASAASRRNHDFIGACIESASCGLGQCLPGFRLNRDGHYQLSNRIAWAWKVASCGVPVVLLYLGFTGDTYFASDYLRDDAHWQSLITTYLTTVAPLEFRTERLTVNGGSLQFLSRSLPVGSVSA